MLSKDSAKVGRFSLGFAFFALAGAFFPCFGRDFFFFFFGGRFAVGLFLSQDGEKALEVGVEFLRIISPFYASQMAYFVAQAVCRHL